MSMVASFAVDLLSSSQKAHSHTLKRPFFLST
jgi:hypothetical protein